MKFKKILSCMLAITVMATQLLPSYSMAANNTKTSDTKKDLVLWYDEPAESWMRQALPIGNGYMGAMVFGGVGDETVQFNEKTLWTGGPGSDGYNFGLTDTVKSYAYNQLMAVREQLSQDGVLYIEKNPTLTDAGFYANNVGFGNYQNFGQLDFEFDDSLSTYSEYKRFLDLRTALSGVRFVSGGITYEREYFANYPENIIAMKLHASEKGAISFNLGVTSAQGGAPTSCVEDGIGIISLAGTVADNGLKYESAVRVVANGGNITASNNKVYVDGADEVTIYLTAGTDYKNEYPTYRGEDPHDAVIGRIERAIELGYDALKESHLKDYQDIFSRVELDLDHDPEQNVPTDEQLMAYFDGKYDSRALEVMLFQYGRYLLIASSREGSLPANLQGVWNDSNTPPWTGDYHFNINVQMNYWPAYVTNISETALTYIDYVDSLRESGRVTAETLLGIKSDEQNPENGWMVNTMNNPFGYTAPYGTWGWTPASNAWVSSGLWEYYEFTQNKEYLENTIYPIIREAAVFWTQALCEKGRRLVSSPSISPENGNFTAGCTYDQELIWQLYTDVIEATRVLDCDEELRQTLIEQREKLDPLHVSERGTLKEWYDEDEEGFFSRDTKHRHISHLIGVYPGKHITSETPIYADAVKASLEERGDGGTGWSRAHKINLWARLGEGNRAHRLIQSQLTRSTDETISYSTGGTYDNLLCACSPFQFDGSAGATAGIAEMLIQSHDGAIAPLAAIPEVWSSGSYSGLVARGNFETSAKWQDGMLSDFSVLSGSGNECVVSYDAIGAATVTCEGEAVAASVSDDGNTVTFDTEAGKQYDIKLPVSPTDVTAIRKTADTIDVAWNKAEGADSYNVYRSENGEDYSLVAQNVKACSYSDVTAVYNSKITYSYKIASVSADGYISMAGPSASETWEHPIEKVEIYSPTGVTTLTSKSNGLPLEAKVYPENVISDDVTWSISDNNLAVIDQDGTVYSTGVAGSDTLTVTAVSKDGRNISDSFEIKVDVAENKNLLSGLKMTLTSGNQYAAAYGTDWLTDGYCGAEIGNTTLGKQRLAIRGNADAVIEVKLNGATEVDTVELYEFISSNTNQGTRITAIKLQSSIDGVTWKDVQNGGTATHSTEKDYMEHWVISGIDLGQKAQYLRFIISGSGITVWEIEAYAKCNPQNHFIGKTVTLSTGTLYNSNYGTKWLTDGFTGGGNTKPDGMTSEGRPGERLALNNSTEAHLDIELASPMSLTTLEIYERTDYDNNHPYRIERVELETSNDGSTWQSAKIRSAVHERIHSYIELWTVNGIETAGPAKYYRLKLYSNTPQPTIWEIKGYTLEKEDTAFVTVYENYGGSVKRSADAPYVTGQEITLTPVTQNGFEFSHWSVDGATVNDAELTVKAGSADYVTAVFKVATPSIEISDGNKAVLSKDARRVYWGYIGTENTEYKWFNDFKAECGDTFTSEYAPKANDTYELTRKGFYRFVVNEDGKDYVYTVECTKDSLPAVDMSAENAVATLSGNARKVYFGYIGEENTAYAGFAPFKETCGDTFTADFSPKDSKAYRMEKEGYYRFVVNYIDQNGKSHDKVFTFKCENAGYGIPEVIYEEGAVTLNSNEATINKMYIGYFGKDEVEVTSWSEFTANSIVRTCIQTPTDSYTTNLKNKGCYVILVNYTDENGKVKDKYFTFIN